MRKSDKKIDNALRQALTEVCEQALIQIEGFAWLTHLVNYDAFPASLKVVCVFETNSDLAKAISSGGGQLLREAVAEKLAAVGIRMKNFDQHLLFDTEERCAIEHNGKWNRRLH